MQTEERIYYSPRGNYCMCANPGRVEEIDGQKRTVGAKMVEFHPMGSGSPNPERPGEQLPPYGCYRTSDPEIIAVLDAHREKLGEATDILTPEEFNEAVVPKTKQIGELKRRLMEVEGKLGEVLANQGKLDGKGRKPPVRETE